VRRGPPSSLLPPRDSPGGGANPAAAAELQLAHRRAVGARGGAEDALLRAPRWRPRRAPLELAAPSARLGRRAGRGPRTTLAHPVRPRPALDLARGGRYATIACRLQYPAARVFCTKGYAIRKSNSAVARWFPSQRAVRWAFFSFTFFPFFFSENPLPCSRATALPGARREYSGDHVFPFTFLAVLSLPFSFQIFPFLPSTSIMC